MAKILSVNKAPGKREITGGQSLSQLSNQIRDLKERVPVMIPIDSIPVIPEFESLFPIKPQNLDSIKESIKLNGFDEKFAVIIAVFPDGSQSLVAGFTRRKASIENQLDEIPAWFQEFESVDAAIDWALHEQLDRRNLTESEVYEYVLRVDQLTGKGYQANGFKGKSSKRTADLVGTSSSKVEKIRTVERDASKDQKEAIKTGKKTINRIHEEIKTQKNKAKASSEASGINPNMSETEASSKASGINPDMSETEASSKASGINPDMSKTEASSEAPGINPDMSKTEASSEASGINPDMSKTEASSEASDKKTHKDWTIEIRGSGISLIRGGDVISLVSLKSMDQLYYGAPYEQIREAVEKYMETVL